MARNRPIVVKDTLSFQKDGFVGSIVVGTEEWFLWLETATGFTYREDGATFTARKRACKGYYYWYAYARRAGQLQCIYLGRTHDLTPQRLHATINRLYPVADTPIRSYTVERYGPRSARAMIAQRYIAGLYTADQSGQQHLDLTRVKEHLHQLGAEIQSEPGQAATVCEQVLDIAYVLLLAFEQVHSTHTRDLAIIQRLLQDAQERIWGYEAMFERHGRGEVF
jgi:hypothetical protein